MSKMTRDEILSMPAGCEMDALIADKVMGWERVGIDGWKTQYGLRTIELTSYGSFHPSTDVAAAWEVVERIREKQTEIRIRGMEWYDGGGWIVEIMDILSKKVQYKSYVEVTGPKRGIPNVCLAICRAGLLAVLTNSIKEKT